MLEAVCSFSFISSIPVIFWLLAIDDDINIAFLIYKSTCQISRKLVDNCGAKKENSIFDSQISLNRDLILPMKVSGIFLGLMVST